MVRDTSGSPGRIILAATSDLVCDQRMQRIAATLSSADYDVLLIGRELPASLPMGPKPYSCRRLSCIARRGPLFYLEYNIRLFLLLLFSRADVFSCADLDTLPAGWLAARIKGSKLVYDAHEYFPESPELEGRTAKRRLWYAAERFLVPRVDAAYTVSDSIRELFRQKYPTEFALIRNMPDLRAVPAADPPRPGYLIYQGALNTGRGLENLITAMAEVDAELWLAGEGDLSEELRELSSRTASGKVRFLGRVEPDRLREITAGALIGFNLLEDMGLSYRYSLANKFFDYIMAGIPQVCIDFKEYRKINEQFEVAVLVADIKPRAIAAAVYELMNNEARCNRLRQNCIRARETLNWQSEEHALLRIYRNVLHGEKGGEIHSE